MSGRLKQLLFAFCTLFVLIVLPIAPVVSASSQTEPVTVIYGVIPALCGGFKGVAQRLDDISQLGADAIWLSPVNETSAGDFGYAITDHYRVKKALGSTNDLKSLISEAHKRHLKVIFDVPLNHLSEEHIFYQDVLKNGSKSEYWDYFQHDKSGQVIYYFDWRNLKNLNFENSSVRSYLINALKHWVQDFDVDGFRMDAAWAIKERYPQFWPVCLNELRTVKPGLFFLAEASALDPYYVRSGFNAAYDWTEKPGEWAWEKAFSKIFSQRSKKFSDSKPAAVLLKSAIEQNANNASHFRFINNNDTGARFSAKYGQPTTRAAATLLMTLPGIPCIYMGEEAGADFLPYGDRRNRLDRHTINWKMHPELAKYYKRLTQLRRKYKALQSQSLTFIDTAADPFVLAYLRPADSQSKDSQSKDSQFDPAASGQSILVIINFSAQKRSVALPPRLCARLVAQDLLTGSFQSIPANLPLPPWAARIYALPAD